MLKPENNAKVSLLSGEMTEWLNDYRMHNFPEDWKLSERCEPRPVTFAWDCKDGESATLLISKSPDMAESDAYPALGGTAAVEDLLPGTQYYWQTLCIRNGAQVKSEVRKFRTLDTPRTVSLPGVSNVRDLGGKKTSDGKTVRYGLAFRGADFANLKEEGVRKAADVLGIKTELDLRNRVQNGTSPLGKEINYISVTAPYYAGIANEDTRADLIEEFRVFCDKNNYPVYFHCSLGRDRTGTLAYLLLAVLGVSEEDIIKDYEISLFSDCGGYIDNAPPSAIFEQVRNLRNIVVTDKEASLAENAAKYLIKAGLTREEINLIRENLLEG